MNVWNCNAVELCLLEFFGVEGVRSIHVLEFYQLVLVVSKRLRRSLLCRPLY